jgi:cytochrome c5
MKFSYLLLPIILVALLLNTQCKVKKAATPTVVVSPDKVLLVAQTKWEGTTQSELDQGKTIYEGKCTTCHGKKNIVVYDEKKWLHEIDDMSPKAKLSMDERIKLTKYILSYREAYTSTN